MSPSRGLAVIISTLVIAACATSRGETAPGSEGPPAHPVALTGPGSEGAVFITRLAQGQFPEASASFLEGKATPDQLAALWKALVDQVGAFQRIERVDADVRGEYRLDFAVCVFGSKRLGVQVTIDQAGRVAGMFLVPADEGQVRKALRELAAGDYAGCAARMSPEVQAKPADLERAWKSAAGDAGALQQIANVTEQGDGILVADCQFERARSRALAVAFDGQSRITSIQGVESAEGWSAPPYVEGQRFDEQPVAVGPHALEGAIDLPMQGGQFPAVVMLSGSGPNDMDESLGSIKAFKDLAQGLATRGILTLRFEKRTHKHVPVKSVVEEYLEDAQAAIELVSKVPGVTKVIVLGHSEGASLAPRVAAANPSVAGLVMLAPSRWPLEKAMVEQLKYQKSQGFAAPNYDSTLAALQRAAAQIEDPALEPNDTVSVLGSLVPGSYFLDLRDYRPVEVAAKLTLPILICWGERDLKVIPEDFAGWKEGLGKRPNVTLRTYPGLQHLFTPVGTAEVGHVLPAVIDDLALWIST